MRQVNVTSKNTQQIKVEVYRKFKRLELKRKAAAAKRTLRMSAWRSCSPRAQARYARQIASGQLRRENGLAA